MLNEDADAPKQLVDKTFAELRKQPLNQKCFECAGPAAWASVTLALYVCYECSGRHRNMGSTISFIQSPTMDNWTWRNLRRLRVGGNERAAKVFGDPDKTNPTDYPRKYIDNAAADKHRNRLSQDVAMDIKLYPDFLRNTTETLPEADEDEFWGKFNNVKKPTPPVSRIGTPPVTGRTSSPLPITGTNGSAISRSASPLPKPDSNGGKPATSRVTTSAALRKTNPTGPRKANILGAKKTTKLGAKKVTADVIDFDEAEKKAKEEAERIEKLGYDPEAEEAETKKKTPAAQTEASNVVSPTPISPRDSASERAGQKSAAEVERLGMGFGRLGFGQVGGSKPTAARAGGFGSVGPAKAATEDDDQRYARNKFGTQKGISSDEFFGKGSFDPSAQAEAKTRLQGFEGATSISSNAYFGRPEEENPEDDYGDLESAAKDFVRKFGITAGDDLDNLTSALGDGATRLQGAIRNYLNG
ncbi:Uu.00g053690.m01.CDS01 [Anthostomella pinea]|uniref:Uu.00g053690.m01.CDS01 n=1 Tax=Anthostomella pinea TaxID=933095 RepID=A0AAI8VWG7_9PEZI|nr:Uu.00g053690.m01.CDS01 [Anthostomella pinea]